MVVKTSIKELDATIGQLAADIEKANADRDATAAKLDAFTKVKRPLTTWRSSTRTSVLRSSIPTNSRLRRRTVRKRTSLH